MDVYNLLPADIVAADTVSIFQKRLHVHMIAGREKPGWQHMYSPRLAIYAHPLRASVRSGETYVTEKTGDVRNHGAACVRGWLAFGQ